MNQLALSFRIEDVFPPAAIFNADPATGEVVGIAKLASDILLILTSAAAILAIIFIIISGIKFLTSSGDEKKIASAASTLTYAIIGLVVTILALVIIRVVQFFFGSNVPVT